MRIATYNVWNDNINNRFEQLIYEITTIHADIIAMQEVTTQFYQDALKDLTEYQYSEFKPYSEEDEGLAIFSKYPFESCTFLHIKEEYCYSNALNVLFKVGNARYSLTNVHLPWDSIKAKEEQAVAIDKFIHDQKELADFFLMVGDFNCSSNSSVHRFLVGDQTLYGNESNPYWLDIAGNYTAITGTSFLPTLDCINNPRWKGKNTIYAPENCDRLYIMDNWNYFAFRNVQLFGTKVSPINNLCAIDHYGVLADIEFSI